MPASGRPNVSRRTAGGSSQRAQATQVAVSLMPYIPTASGRGRAGDRRAGDTSPSRSASAAAREVRMLEQRAGLVPARHDRAALRLEQRERAAGVDLLLQHDPAAARDGRERADDEAAAPEERHVPPPRVVGRDAERTRRCAAPDVVSAPCACTTAFACAVVPDVKKTVATSVGDTRALERRRGTRRRRRARARPSARRRACRRGAACRARAGSRGAARGTRRPGAVRARCRRARAPAPSGRPGSRASGSRRA